MLAAFGRLVAERGDGLTNCLFFVDRDFDEYSGGTNPSDWRVFVTAGYSFESDYAFGPSIRVLAQNVMAVHWDSHEVGICEQRYSEAINEFAVALTPLLGVAVYCQSEGCRITFDNTGIEQLFEFDDEGQPTRKKKALETFLTRSLESGTIPSIWAARTFVRKLRAAKCKASIRGKYALAFLRIYVHRLMQSLRATGVEFVQVDTGNRFLAQILAQHIELQGLREFLLTARGRLSCPC